MGSGIRGRTKGEEKRGPGELRGWPESGRTTCLQNMAQLCGTFLEAGDSSGALEMNPRADLHVLRRSYGEDMEHLLLGRGLQSAFRTRQIAGVQQLDAHRPHLVSKQAAFHPGVFLTATARSSRSRGLETLQASGRLPELCPHLDSLQLI